jgi:hypothetical protein
MSFNPANFPFTMPSLDKPKAAPAQVQRITSATAQKVQALEQAAARFEVRRDSFALGKADTCMDLARKLEHFGSFVSEKQAAFADKLIEWSLPRQSPSDKAGTVAHVVAERQMAAPEAAKVLVPKLFDLMQRLSKLTIGKLVIARKNQDSLCWVKLEGRDGVVGKIENGVVVLFVGRMGRDMADSVLADLQHIEKDPEAAAALHGKLSGRCSVCSRDLTDPVSIERGIGPICAEKF